MSDNKNLERECGLSEDSILYYEYAEIYNTFCQAEDKPEKVAAYLLPRIGGNIILDIGCGTGKYAGLLASKTKVYFGIDQSQNQLRIFRRNQSPHHVIQGCAQQLPFSSGSIDVVIATWTIGSIRSVERKIEAIEEAKRVVNYFGRMYIVENDPCSDFQSIRGEGYRCKERSFNKWLLRQGFSVEACINTYFEFSNVQTAKTVFERIWGREVSKKVIRKRIDHNILIYSNGGSHE